MDFLKPQLYDQFRVSRIHKVEGSKRSTLISGVGIDMVDEQGDVLLCKRFQRSALRDRIADQLVIFFNTALLIGLAGIAVKDSGSIQAVMRIQRLLKRDRIFELRTVVSQNDRKKLPEKIKAQAGLQPMKLTQRVFHILVVHKEGKHEAKRAQVYGKENLILPFLAFNSIHFRDINIGILSGKEKEILIRTALAVTVVAGCARRLLALLVAYFSSKVKISNGKEPLGDVLVERSAGAGDFMGMTGVNMGDRLAFQDQGGNKIIKVGKFPWLKIDPLAGLLKRSKIGLMSGRGPVVKLLKRAATLTVTGVADIRRLGNNGAGHRLVPFA